MNSLIKKLYTNVSINKSKKQLAPYKHHEISPDDITDFSPFYEYCG